MLKKPITIGIQNLGRSVKSGAPDKRPKYVPPEQRQKIRQLADQLAEVHSRRARDDIYGIAILAF